MSTTAKCGKATILLTLLTVTISLTAAIPTVASFVTELPCVSQVTMTIQGTLTKTFANPSSTIAIPLTNYTVGTESVETTVTIIANNPNECYISWLFYSGLENSIITGVSSRGLVGSQISSEEWRLSSRDKKIMIQSVGSIELLELEEMPKQTKTIALLLYGNSIASKPVISVSVYLEEIVEPKPQTLKIQAEASIKKLRLEIQEASDLDTTYYKSELLASELFYEKGDYNQSLTTSSSALQILRDAKLESNSFVANLIRFLGNWWFLIVLPLAVVIGIGALRRKRNNKGSGL